MKEQKAPKLKLPTWLPLLPLRDVVVYPHMIIPLFVGREKSVRALDKAMNNNKQIVLVTQKQASENDPGAKDLYSIGILANILQLLKLPDGTIKVLIEGVQRVQIAHLIEDEDDGHFSVQTQVLKETQTDEREMEALMRSLVGQFDQYAKLHKKIPPEVLSSLSGTDDPGRLADAIAAHLAVKIENKQAVLEHVNLNARIEYLIKLLESEIEALQIEKRIRGRVKSQMEKSQREYYLNEQMKAIQRELGESDAPGEIEELEEKIKKAGMSKEAKKKATSELNKLKMMSPMSAEATVVRNYVDWLVNVPWKQRSKTCNDLAQAEKVLEEDHYGLEKVKERILEHLAVQQRIRKMKGPILCLVGPPGVGKTSLGRSIARATGREFVRMSLGGVRDEAEICGHRRTYIGSLPGKLIQCMAKVGKKNPLFLLDEVDKMTTDFRGDPASALLEVLDPEQNHAFNDHYLEVDYDLSEVMFVTTANNSIHIPLPLLDRMEVIRLSGYTEDEKVHIALKYLIPKQFQANGLKGKELSFRGAAIRDIVRHYTREAGVRNLEREIAKICRKTVKQILSRKERAGGAQAARTVTPRRLESLIGIQRFRYGRAEEQDRIGQATGLAWTEVGGDLLTIEVAVVPGKGKAAQTGKLGDVMKESIQAAMTVVRGRSEIIGLDAEFFQAHDFHIHVPEGAIPKDGPSAGVAMVTALVSVLADIPVRANVAMTGEITLRGEILPIGGLKEKLLAALRGGIDTVLIPKENERELAEIPKNILQNLDIRPLRWIDELLEVALQRPIRLYPPGKKRKESLEMIETAASGRKEKPPHTPPRH